MSVYTGIANGSVQAAVYDQPASALPGQLYGAAETNLIDSIAVGEANGIGVGLGIVAAYIDPSFPGINNKAATLPDSNTTAAMFGGIVVRNQTAQTDANGMVFIGADRMADILRPKRAGGRIWVNANNVNLAGGDVYWIVQDTAGHGFPIGSFSGEALGAAGIDTVELTGVEFASVGVAGKPVLIEMG